MDGYAFAAVSWCGQPLTLRVVGTALAARRGRAQ